MTKVIVRRAANVLIRGSAVGSRFLLVLFLAKFLEPDLLGLYGTLTASVVFAVLAVGIEFYTYSQRELLGLPRDEWSFVIQHQVIAQTFVYLLFLPIVAGLLWYGVVPGSIVLWFCLLLVLEHIGSEINRLLIVMERQLLAGVILFIRSALWVWIVLPVMWWDPATRQLDVVLGAWALGAFAAVILGALAIRASIDSWKAWPIDRNWIMRGYRTALKFAVATVALKALVTIDRYAVGLMADATELGVYVFYSGTVLALFGLLDMAVFSFLYPGLVRAVKNRDVTRYEAIYRELLLATVGVSVFVSIVAYFGVPLLVDWIAKPVYFEYTNILVVLIMAGFVFALGHVPHYVLYARSRDNWILSANLAGVLVFLVLVSLDWGESVLARTAASLLYAFCTVGAVKLVGQFATRSDLPATPKPV